jgi:hypothetical protein
MCVNLVVMIFIFDEKLGTRRGWHRAKTVGLLCFLIATHFHSPKQRWYFSLPRKASKVPQQHEV